MLKLSTQLRARIGVRAALWAAGAGVIGIGAASPAPLAAQSYSGQERPGAAELRNAVRRLASNPQDLDALIDAGNASLQLGDVNGAVDFFTRAEAIAPNNGDVKVGLATAMLRKENPVEALRLFDEAERLGMPARSFALDRGLAYDLVGDFGNAERQYQMASSLSGPSDEITLRRGISLGVQGREEESTLVMMPLLEKNDPGAWRAQAFIYAANGHMADADGVAKSFLGDQKAQSMQPYFQRMPVLTPAQKMAAIHFGHFPTQNIGVDSPQIAAMARAPSADRLTPQGQPFGPSTPPSTGGAKGTAQVAATGAKPPKFIDFNGRPQKNLRYTPPSRTPTPVEVAAVNIPPVQSPPVEVAPPITAPVIAPPVQAPVVQTPVVQAASIPAEPVATVTRAPDPVAAGPAAGPVAAPAFETNPGRPAAGPPAAEPVAKVTMTPAGLPSGYQPSVPAKNAAAEAPTLPPAGYSETAGTYVDSLGVTRRIGADGAITTVAEATPKPVVATPAPVVAEPTPVPAPEVLLPPVVQAAAQPAAPQSDSVTAPVVANTPEPAPRRPDLTSVVGSVAVPEEEKATTVVPVTPDVIASAAPAPTPAPAPRIVTPKKEPAKTEPAKAATPKPMAKPAAPKAETAKSTAKKEDNPAAKHPKRNWVQLATGDNVPALRQDYRNLARKNPDMFKGLSGWTAPWGKQRRMVVGPFETLAEAKAWDKKWRAAGGDSYVWQSEDGSVVEPLPTR